MIKPGLQNCREKRAKEDHTRQDGVTAVSERRPCSGLRGEAGGSWSAGLAAIVLLFYFSVTVSSQYYFVFLSGVQHSGYVIIC